MASHLS